MKFPKMGVFDYGYGVHGSTTFDRELPGGKGVMESSDIAENLRKWFKEKWVRFGPDGKIRGQCARDDDSEGKPKCLPQSKAHALGKKGRASAAARKRRKDPNPERSGSAINVKTKESIDLKKESKITDVGVTADQLNIGDEVIVTGKVKFSGATGRIADFGRDKAFVVVDLYNHGKHSFHSSDVEENLYAGSEEEEEELYHRDSDYRKLRDFDEQDVAEGNLTEIGFASALDDENYQPEELLKIGKDVGSIEGNQVMMARSGSEKAYFLVVDGKVTSFLGFKNGKLKNIKNFTNSAGVIRALVGFLVHKMQQKIIISSDESLTQDGLNWVMRLVKSPRGLKITDQTGNSIDVEFLKKEWITARETGSSGPTGIIIGENTEFGTKVRINEAALEEKTLLMPLKFYKIEHMELRMKKKQIVSEAKSLLKRVRVVQGPHKGKLGMIRQIKHGMFKGAPKAYFIDLDDGGQADNLPATALRLVRDERGVAENKEELTSLKAKANEISDKIDAIVKKGGRVGLNDPLSQQLKAIRAKIQKAKKKDISENSDYFRRRKGEEDIISGKKPGRKRAPTQTSDYARRREQEKAKEQGVAENRFDEPLSGYRIVYRKSGYPVTNTPRFETREAAQKYLMTKMSANHQNYQVTQFAEVAEASFTAAAALHAATRKQSGGKTAQPTHGIKVGDEITTADGKKGQVHFVQGDTVHVKGTNPYFPDKIKQYSASDLKKGMTEAAVGQSIDYAVWSQKSPRDQSRLMKDYPKLKILNKPSEPSAPKVQPKKLTLDDVWRKVESVVAQVYPDADPIDWLTPWFQKHGIRDFKIGEILDRAARKNGYKDLYDYYHSMSELYPGQQGVAEGANIQIPTKDGITWQDIRLMAGEGKLTKKTVLQAIAVIRKQRREQGVAEAKSKSATSNEDIVRWEVRMGDGTVKSFTDLLAAQKLFKQAQKGKYGKFAELVPVKKQDVQALDAYLSGIFKKHGAGKMKKGVSEAAESLTGVKLYNAIAGIMRANPALKFSSKESDAGSFKAWYQRINKVDVPALVAQLKAIDASVVLEKGQPWSIQGQNFRVEGPDLDYRGDSGLFLEVYRTGPGGALRRAGSDEPVSEAQDACYHKVKSRYKVWPSAYASGALVQCRKKGAKNWGNKSTNESKLEELISSFKSNLDDI
jgi:preprotein translocase subunit YajC